MNTRTITILKAIIDEYVSTGEPIGSKSLLEKYGFGVSSATVRNEMSNLENQGYLAHTHTSSGRIPSDKGYRYYVNGLVDSFDDKEYFKTIIDRFYTLSQIDSALEDMSERLSKKTNYAALSMRKTYKKNNRVVTIHIIEVDTKVIEYALIVVLENRKIINKIIRFSTIINVEKVLNYINKVVDFKTIDEIKKQDLIEVELFDLETQEVCYTILNEIILVLNQENDYGMVFKGKENLLAYPEFKNSNEAKMILETLGKKQQLVELFDHLEGQKINISIGSENNEKGLDNVSLASKVIDLGEYGSAIICLAGPTRMNYKKVIDCFSDLGKIIDEFIK